MVYYYSDVSNPKDEMIIIYDNKLLSTGVCVMDTERRGSRRMGLESPLVIKRIDDGREDYIEIDTHDISKSGCGFISKEDLELNTIYESHIRIWTKEIIHVLLKIVRKVEQEDGFLYGAIFLGLSDIDAFRIEVYDMLDRANREKEDGIS